MKSIKNLHSEGDYFFRGQDPDKRTARQWVIDMERKHGYKWSNGKWAQYRIDVEDGLVKPFYK